MATITRRVAIQCDDAAEYAAAVANLDAYEASEFPSPAIIEQDEAALRVVFEIVTTEGLA